MDISDPPRQAQKSGAAPLTERPFSKTQLFCSNLPWSVNGKMLRQAFEEHGEVVDAFVAYNGRSSRGFGYVTFKNPQDATAALKAQQEGRVVSLGDEETERAREIRVEMARERPGPRPEPRERAGERPRDGGERSDRVRSSRDAEGGRGRTDCEGGRGGRGRGRSGESDGDGRGDGRNRRPRTSRGRGGKGEGGDAAGTGPDRGERKPAQPAEALAADAVTLRVTGNAPQSTVEESSES